MRKFSNLDLKWYEEEDLEDLEEEYPGLFDKTPEELDEMASELYWKAENLYAEVARLESQADSIRLYLKVTAEQKGKD